MEEAQVMIKNHAFNPQSLEIEKGTKVIWKNEDLVPHTVVSDPDGGIFKSGIVIYGTTTSFPFESSGRYPYHCSIHPNMHGEIIVK